MSCVIRCGCTLFAGGFNVALSPSGGERAQNQRYVYKQRVNVETHTDIAIHGQMSGGCRKGRTLKGMLWQFLAETGLHWQHGMAHHDRFVADNRTK